MTKQEIINETVEKINDKQGENTVVVASEIIPKKNVKTQTVGGCKVRNLNKDEIECKIQAIKDGQGLTLLLYKTARTDILILDEMFGKMNWQCEYKEIKGNMYCGISVYDEIKSQWVTKWDCGVESAFGDKQKGEASDAFKRAGFKWGIGIELYTAPFIWIPSDKCNIRNGKCYDKFEVENIAIENKVITGLAIRNITKNNQRVFVWKLNKERNKEN